MRHLLPSPALLTAAVLTALAISSLSAAAEDRPRDAGANGEVESGSDDFSADDFVYGSTDPFDDEITVSLVSIVARIVDPWGKALSDLHPSEVLATIGGEPVEVTAIDWHGFEPTQPGNTGLQPATGGRGPEAELEAGIEAELEAEAWSPPAPSRHIVIVMQIGGHMVVTLEKTHIRGHLKSLPGLRNLLAGLRPKDRVALVSFDSRMKLWQDFTTDHQAVESRLFDTIGFAEPEPLKDAPAQGQPSIARWISGDRMRGATSAAELAQILAEAMREVPGLKDVIWVGWGFGRGITGAIRTMQQTGTVVSVLDVSQSDYHLLEGGLKSIATSTGGTYGKLFKFPMRSVERLDRVLAGYFVVTLDLSGLDVRGALRLEVKGREGKVLMKPHRF